METSLMLVSLGRSTLTLVRKRTPRALRQARKRILDDVKVWWQSGPMTVYLHRKCLVALLMQNRSANIKD